MSRLEVITKTKAQSVVDDLYKDLERRIVAAPPGLCPVDMTASFLKLFHTQTCGKCVPCRIGLGLLVETLEDVLDGKATLEDGTIAGSATCLAECFRRAVSFGVPLDAALRAATINPAQAVGLFDELGSITAGKRADILVLDETLHPEKIFIGGVQTK